MVPAEPGNDPEVDLAGSGSSEDATATKGIHLQKQVLRPAPGDGVCLALTFGTLLSSQGADAHQVRTFRLFPWGNPSKLRIFLTEVKSLAKLFFGEIGIASDQLLLRSGSTRFLRNDPYLRW